MTAMTDLRSHRSSHPDEAIHLLLEAVSKSRRGRGIALVDERGRMLAGAGRARETWAAVRAAQGRRAPADGFVSWDVIGGKEPMRLATFGTPTGLSRTAAGVARILRALG
jgi:hypothetical protein